MTSSNEGTAYPDPGRISHWFAQLHPPGGPPLTRRPALSQSRRADVCIVGAGYTGLWAAYELLRHNPDLDVVLLDAEIAGYGASGRNGGAVIAQVNGSRAYWSKRGGRDGAIAMERAVADAVDEVGNVVAEESIDCSYAKNGVLMAARTRLEADRFRRSVHEDREWGLTDEDSRYLEADELSSRVRVAGGLGARFNAHCASIHPGALVRGLADVVERKGATIYEDTRVETIEAGAARTTRGQTVTARFVLRATEAYTESLASHRARLVPVYTSMIVTEPIAPAQWEQVGWAGREALLAEHPFLHLQHTADARITIGGDDNRIPYRYGSAPCPDGPPPERVREMYRHQLVRLFPALADVRIEHAWQGIFAASRNWAPAVTFDRASGLAWAGGYVGEGVAVSNLAGRTVAHLILGMPSPLTQLPLVSDTEPRRWEPEPLRMVGAAAIWGMRSLGELTERRTGKPSRLIDLGNGLAGFTGHIG